MLAEQVEVAGAVEDKRSQAVVDFMLKSGEVLWLAASYREASLARGRVMGELRSRGIEPEWVRQGGIKIGDAVVGGLVRFESTTRGYISAHRLWVPDVFTAEGFIDGRVANLLEARGIPNLEVVD